MDNGNMGIDAAGRASVEGNYIMDHSQRTPSNLPKLEKGFINTPVDTPTSTFSPPRFISGSQYPGNIPSPAMRYGEGLEMPTGTFQNMEDTSMDTENKSNCSGGPIAWGESKTKAGKERKRLPLACISCRRKKIKCSGEKPSCAHCLRSRTPCVYKQAARKAVSSRVDYMATIDRRLKRMEDQLIKHVPREEVSAILASTGRSVAKPHSTTSSNARASQGSKRNSYMAFGDAELDAWASNTQFDILSGRPNEVGYTAAPIKATAHDEGWSALPSKEVQEHLTEVYFDYVYGQVYFLLHKPSFLRRLRANMVPPVLILAVCAVSARFSKHPAVKSNPPYLAGEQWAREAEKIILKHYDEPSLTHLTACLLLGLHELGTCQGGRSWALGGMATRMAFAMQLHREPDDSPTGKGTDKSDQITFTDRELRRRAMWACFVMDRFNSSGTQRPPSILEADIFVQLPVNDKYLELDMPAASEKLDGTVTPGEDPEEAKRSTGVIAYMIRVVALYGRILRYLNLGGKERDPVAPWHEDSQFRALHKEAKAFIDNTPEHLQYNDENLAQHAAERLACQFLFFHIASQHCILFLHRFSFPTNPSIWSAEGEQPPEDFLAKSAQFAIDAAESISQLLAKAAEKNYPLVAPFMGYCAFTSAAVHVVRAFAPEKATRDLAKKYLSINLRFLGQMSRYWGFLGFITDVLRNQYNECSRTYQSGESPSLNRRDKEKLVMYGDWFQKYPRGVRSLSSDDTSYRNDATLALRSDLQTADGFFNRLGAQQHQKPAKSGSKVMPLSGSAPQAKRRETMEHTQGFQPAAQQQTNVAPNDFASAQFQNPPNPPPITTQMDSVSQEYSRAQPQQPVSSMPAQPAQTFSPIDQHHQQPFLFSSYSHPTNFAKISPQTSQSLNTLNTPTTTMSPTNIPWGFEVQAMDFGNSMFESSNLESGLQWFSPFNMDLAVKFPDNLPQGSLSNDGFN